MTEYDDDGNEVCPYCGGTLLNRTGGINQDEYWKQCIDCGRSVDD